MDQTDLKLGWAASGVPKTILQIVAIGIGLAFLIVGAYQEPNTFAIIGGIIIIIAIGGTFVKSIDSKLLGKIEFAFDQNDQKISILKKALEAAPQAQVMETLSAMGMKKPEKTERPAGAAQALAEKQARLLELFNQTEAARSQEDLNRIKDELVRL